MASNMLAIITWHVAITPIKAHFTLFKETISDFLVRLCGIVGGIFAAATILESLVRNGLCLMIPEGMFDGDEDDDDAARKKRAAQNT